MSKVQAAKVKKSIPTYIPKKANDLPMFFENKPYQGATGRLYPIPYSDGITDEKRDVSYDVFTLENEYVRTEVLPAIGGKLLSGYDKIHQYDFIYRNEVIKPALVGLAGAWISGGIEFNWPQHHRPTTFMPVQARIEENPDGSKTVWTGEVEPFNRMKAMAGITLDEGRSYIKARVRIYNRTAQAHPFMWWANLAVPVNDQYRTVFPPDVEYVNDHDRRAVMSWPIAKGVYKTARPYDFGDGTDLSHYDAVKVPSSYLVSQGQSDMDFVSGYDTGKGKGIATIANHHIAPGKKMWHWGIGDFGDMWCSNLTDENGPYIELMTGVFTDNQPDFTWIAPYESKEFEQYWYPIHAIGEIKNASIDAAINLEKRGENAYVGLNVTGVFKNAKLIVKAGEQTLFETAADMDPRDAFEVTFPLNGADFYDVKAALFDGTGRSLIAYQPYVRGQKQPIDVRTPVKRPAEIETVEELYINGYHLEQYKQHNYRPQDYYLEGLKRDPGDIRCNTSMARLMLKNGSFAEAVRYADKAIERLTSRNQHPTDTEAFYLKGLALEYLGNTEEAYKILYKAAWNYTHRSAALFELANLDLRRGSLKDALDKLDESLLFNAKNEKALVLKSAVMRLLSEKDPDEQERTVWKKKAETLADANRKNDLLDLYAAVEFLHHTDEPLDLSDFTENQENFLNVANDYLHAGLYEDARFTLSLIPDPNPLVNYYRGFIAALMGNADEAETFVKTANAQDTGFCFPAALEDIAVLKYAESCDPCGANAYYYLGCLLYDRFRYEEAQKEWEKAVSLLPSNGKTWRNLAFCYFDKTHEPEKALDAMKKALLYKGDDPRLLLEYEQLLKNTNAPVEERLKVYEQYPELLKARDDCYLDRLTLISQTGELKRAIDLAAAKRFHIYEGGEGKLTKQHAWMYVLYGNELAKAGKVQEAENAYQNGTVVPKSYGEAKTFFNQEAHLYYYLGRLYEAQGRTEDAGNAYEKAAVYKAAVSEISLFRALALQKLGRNSEADAVLDEMIAAGENAIVNKDLRSYYGVGSPSPMPFENDIEKQNLKSGNILLAYAALGKGDKEQADRFLAEASKQDPNDFLIYAYRCIRKTF